MRKKSPDRTVQEKITFTCNKIIAAAFDLSAFCGGGKLMWIMRVLAGTHVSRYTENWIK